MNKLHMVGLAAMLLILSGSAFLIATSTTTSNDLSFKKINYTFYQVEIEWPGSVCKFHDCNRRDLANFNGKHFNLHGVWPTGSPNNQCQYVNSCQALPFDNSLITPQVMAGLDQYWTGVYNPSETFRQHEWEKHGVCWNDDSTQGFLKEDNLSAYMNNYFSLALSVIQKYEPLNVLSNYSIYPSDTIPFQYTTAINALKPTFGEGVVGKCQMVDGKQYLHSVDFCLGLNYQPIDCPCAKAKKSNCNAANPVYLGEFVMPSN